MYNPLARFLQTIPSARLGVCCRDVRLCAIAVFLVAFSVRLALLPAVTLRERPEPIRIALSLAQKGAYADAFGDGGPTAHCLPLHPLIAAAVFRVVGSGTSAWIAMSILASLCVSLGYALLPALAVACRLSPAAGLLAGMLGALLPVNFWAQTTGVFEAPFSLLALVVLCYLISRSWTENRFGVRQAIEAGITAGLGCLLNSAFVFILIAWFALGIRRFHGKRPEFVRFVAIVAVLVLAILTPWTIRNYRVFGKLIWARSNFGLELHQSNSEFATANGELKMQNPAWLAHHPLTSDTEREKVRRMGEPSYNAARQAQAMSWIKAHPVPFASLTVQRVLLFWFPPMFRRWQAVLQAVFTILAAGGLIFLFKTRRAAGAAAVIVVLITYPLVYYVIEASPRYRYPIEPLLLLLGGYFLSLMRSGFTTGAEAAAERS